MSVETRRSTVYLMHIGTFMYIAGVIKCRRVNKPALDMVSGCDLVSAGTAQSSGMTLQRVFIRKTIDQEPSLLLLSVYYAMTRLSDHVLTRKPTSVLSVCDKRKKM